MRSGSVSASAAGLSSRRSSDKPCRQERRSSRQRDRGHDSGAVPGRSHGTGPGGLEPSCELFGAGESVCRHLRQRLREYFRRWGDTEGRTTRSLGTRLACAWRRLLVASLRRMAARPPASRTARSRASRCRSGRPRFPSPLLARDSYRSRVPTASPVSVNRVARRRLDRAGHPEVGHHSVVPFEQDVLGLDVAVHDAAGGHSPTPRLPRGRCAAPRRRASGSRAGGGAADFPPRHTA